MLGMRPPRRPLGRPFLWPAMNKKLLAIAVVLFAGGCTMCADTCDYSSSVPGGAPLGLTRSGSNLSGGQTLPSPVATPTVEDDYGNALSPAIETGP